MTAAANWRPRATRDTLRARAAMLAATREFFAARNVLEVETPTLCEHATTDTFIASLRLAGPAAPWLRTSPEYHMKRLLADGSGDIYQIGKAFRADESGTRHHPEFTLVEWYRYGFGLAEMIAETCELITTLLRAGAVPAGQPRTLTYRDAFLETLHIDPLTAEQQALLSAARSLPGWHAELEHALGNDRGRMLDALASHAVYPALPSGRLQVIRDYPADQAMLARLDPATPEVAQRFEVFLNGIELANGFRELQDADEQRLRFATDNERRRQLGLPEIPPDEYLLAALGHGLPDCSGVAVGLDRVLMLSGGHATLDTTVSFVPGE